jgi:hypothetical protein
MTEEAFGRRDFLKGAVVGGAAAATTRLEVAPAQAQPATPVPAAGAGSPAMGYACLNLDEAAFVEALVDHMIPADEYTPKGTDLGINIYIDRALAGGWGKGERRVRATSSRSFPPTSIAPASRRPTPIAARPTARRSTGSTPSSAKRCWSAFRPAR